MKAVMARIAKILVFSLVLILVVDQAGYVLRDKTDATSVSTFREEQADSVDVLVLGSSHVYRYLHPMYWWNYYGITAYNLGSSEQTLAQSYHMLNMALNTQKPQVVVLGLSMLRWNQKSLSDARNHLILDNMPHSIQWVQALYDLVDDNRYEYLFPALAYHSRWNELTEKDWQKMVSHEQGALMNFKTTEFEMPELLSEDETAEIPAMSLEYLMKIIELCQKNDIQLLLTILPYPAIEEDTQRYCNTVKLLAEEYEGVDYLRLIDSWEEIGLDGSTDFSDKKHVNMDGAYKVTDYMGRYLTANYDLPDRREDPAYSYWSDDFETYLREMTDKLNKQKKEFRERYLPKIENRLADYYQGGSTDN